MNSAAASRRRQHFDKRADADGVSRLRQDSAQQPAENTQLIASAASCHTLFIAAEIIL